MSSPTEPATPGSPPSIFRDFWSLSLLANHFPPLHGLRFLAVVGVVQFHVTAILFENKLMKDEVVGTLSLTFFFGMDLFFVLSGFLIGTILLVSLERHGRQMVGNFYARRAFRIIPLYYIVLTMLSLVSPLTAAQRQHLPLEYLYLTNFVPDLQRTTVVMIWGWSLALEEQFYLTVPLLLGALALVRGHRGRLVLLGALFASALVVRMTLFLQHPGWGEGEMFQRLYLRTYTRYDTLMAGVLMAYIQRYFQPQVKAFFADTTRRRLMLGLVFVLLMMLLFPNTWERWTTLFKVFSWGTITSVMYMVLVLYLINHPSDLADFLGSRWFLYLATLGYGIYLMHIPLFDWISVPLARRLVAARFPLAIVWPVSLVTNLVTTIAVSYLLHVFIEKPALWVRDRLAPSPALARPAATTEPVETPTGGEVQARPEG